MDAQTHMPAPASTQQQQHHHQNYDAQNTASYNSSAAVQPAMQSLQSAQYPPVMQAQQPPFNQPPHGVIPQAAPQSQSTVNSSMSSEQSQQHAAAAPMDNTPAQETPLIDFG